MKKKKIIGTKTYTITQTDYDDGTLSINRTTKGFSGMEQIGILTFALDSVKKEMFESETNKTYKDETRG